MDMVNAESTTPFHANKNQTSLLTQSPKQKDNFYYLTRSSSVVLALVVGSPPGVVTSQEYSRKTTKSKRLRIALEEIWFLTLIGLWHQDTIRCNMLLVTAWMVGKKTPRNPQPSSFCCIALLVFGIAIWSSVKSLPACLLANFNNKSNKGEKKFARRSEYYIITLPMYSLSYCTIQINTLQRQKKKRELTSRCSHAAIHY